MAAAMPMTLIRTIIIVNVTMALFGTCRDSGAVWTVWSSVVIDST